MTSESPSLGNIDIEAYILNEYIPAKPLDGNLEVHFSDSELVRTVHRCRRCLNHLFSGTYGSMCAAEMRRTFKIPICSARVSAEGSGDKKERRSRPR